MAAQPREALEEASQVARTLASLLVVLVHANHWLRPAMAGWWPGGTWLAPLYGLPVPFFIFLSGFSAGPTEGRAWGPYLAQKGRALLVPLFVWDLLLLSLMGSLVAPFSATWWVCLCTGTWHLYYLTVLLQLLVLQRALGVRFRGPRARLWLGAALGCSAAFYLAASIHLRLAGAGASLWEAWLNRTFLPWIGFYLLGMTLRRRPELAETWWRQRWGLALVALAGLWLHGAELRAEDALVGYNPLQQFLASAFVFQIAGVLLSTALLAAWVRGGAAARTRHWLAAQGGATYGIYLVHGAILLAALGLYNTLGPVLPFHLEVPALGLLTWLGARSLAGELRRHRWLRFLFLGLPRGAAPLAAEPTRTPLQD